jgi:hypothetical protein
LNPSTRHHLYPLSNPFFRPVCSLLEYVPNLPWQLTGSEQIRTAPRVTETVAIRAPPCTQVAFPHQPFLPFSYSYILSIQTINSGCRFSLTRSSLGAMSETRSIGSTESKSRLSGLHPYPRCVEQSPSLDVQSAWRQWDHVLPSTLWRLSVT